MGSQTSVWDLRYPDSTDDVRVDEDIKALADDAETALNTVDLYLPRFAIKPSNEVLPSSTTLQNDDHLVKSGVAGATYEFELLLKFITNAAADIKLGWSIPAGSGNAMMWTSEEGNPSNLVAVMQGPYDASAVTNINGTGADQVLRASGLWVVGATGGNLQLRWAQVTSHASNTTVYLNSYLRLQRTRS